MLEKSITVQQNSKMMDCPTILLSLTCLIIAGTSFFLNIWVIQHVQTQFIPTTLAYMGAALNSSNVKPTNQPIKLPNISQIIYCYKRMFQYTNLMYDMLQQNRDLEHLRFLVDDVTKPVFITNEPTLDRDTYKSIFLMMVKKLASKELNEDEQRLIIYATDFVNLYLSIQI